MRILGLNIVDNTSEAKYKNPYSLNVLNIQQIGVHEYIWQYNNATHQVAQSKHKLTSS
jgi:hypothetical protein